MRKIKSWFANLKLQYKLMLSMSGVTTVVLLAIIYISYQNYFATNFSAEMEKSQQAVNRAAKSLHNTFSSLTLKTSRMLLDTTMKEVILLLESAPSARYADNYQYVSTTLENFVSDNDTLASAYLFSPSFLYGTASASLQQNPYDLIDDRLWTLDTITYLPFSYNEKTRTSRVFPILYPVTSIYTTSGTLLNYGASQHGLPVLFAAFFDERYLTETLTRFSTSMTDSFYLVNAAGQPLNRNFGRLDAETLTQINTFMMEQPSLANAPLRIGGDTYYITAQPVGNGGLRIVHVFSNSTIVRSIRPMLLFLVLIWALGIACSCLLSSVIAHFLTRPFRKLTEVIDQINHNTYTRKAEFRYRDESGLLGTQINQMYDTIQQQIVMIKEEEQQKAKAEIQMYAEQINPHFLYNTLECIHFQMLNDHREAAGLMLESLGKYLRLTLSHGQTTIPLSKEIQHVTEYMAIINRHSATARITFDCTCQPHLTTHLIMKLILQPIAENAVKHGFPQDLSSYMVPPAIRIDIKKTGPHLLLAVTDNGQGFDPAYADACMRNKEFQQGVHFGLRNVYQRLVTYYGNDAGITFESIPYYANTVTIKIPW